MLHSPLKQTGNQATPPAKIRDASRKDWPGPRWPFVVVQNDDGSVSIPLPLNEH